MNPSTVQCRPATLKAGERTLPLTKMEVVGTVTGLLHRTKVNQTFLNDHDVPLEAVYTHPLPPKAAVHGFRLVIGERVVTGAVAERGQARRAYTEAVAQGHRAALMEEERSDIFTTTVGNIAPGETVEISFELSGPLECLESTASLRFPLVVPEVYISGQPLAGSDVGDGVASDTNCVPDASRITPPRLAPGAPNPVDLRLCFTVDPAGLKVREVRSLCHFAKCGLREDGLYEISLLPGLERMTHDFVVELSLAEETLMSTLVHDPATGTFALTVVPPLGSAAKLGGRDLVIVLDRSGSMQGWSMTAARRAAARIVESLTAGDRFAIISFDNNCEQFSSDLVKADARQQQLALDFLSKVDARGGTEARPAIELALSKLNRENARDKTVLFLTDGDVGNDSELVVRSAQGIRVSTVGVGVNLRAGVLEAMAKTSGGLCTLIPDESTLEEALRNLHQRLGRPHWMGLTLANHKDPDPAPRFWDVWEGVPTTFFGKAEQLPETVTVEGWGVSVGKRSQQVKVLRREDLVISRSWARARLLDLDDLWTIGKATPAELVALSVSAQVLCRFTAFVAIDKAERVANAESMKTVVQPVEPTIGGLLCQARFEAEGSAAPRLQAPLASPADFELYDALPVEDAGIAGAADFARLPSPPAPPLARASRPPAPRKERAVKKELSPQKQNFWSELLEKLERLSQLNGQARTELVSELIDSVGVYYRKLPAGSPATAITANVMSLLVDLKKALGRPDEVAVFLSALRSVVEIAERLPE